MTESERFDPGSIPSPAEPRACAACGERVPPPESAQNSGNQARAARGPESPAQGGAHLLMHFELSADDRIHRCQQGSIPGVDLPAASLIGQSIAAVLPAELAHRFLGAMAQARSALAVVSIEYVLDTARGAACYEAYFLPLPGGNVIVFVRDVTQRWLIEDKARKYEKRLQYAQRAESLGVLAGGIAHDLSNVLGGILTTANLVADSLGAESPLRPLIARIERAACRAADLTKQVLAYSGKGALAAESLSLSELVDEMDRLLESAIPKTIVRQKSLATGLPLVEGDRTQIRQVVMNLIINAVDAIGSAGGLITLTTGTMYADRTYLEQSAFGEALPAGEYAYIEVRDTGHGMDGATKAAIFEPFFTTKPAGHGLGLAAVPSILQAHQAAIRVESEPGTGSSFRVLFPVVSAESADGGEVSAADGAVRTAVLLISSDRTSRCIVQESLGRAGFDVRVADGGHPARDIIEQRELPVDVVIVDGTRCNVDWARTVQTVNRLAPCVPVLVVSDDVPSRAEHIAAGFGIVDHIRQPLRPGALVEKLRRLVDVRRQSTSLPV